MSSIRHIQIQAQKIKPIISHDYSSWTKIKSIFHPNSWEITARKHLVDIYFQNFSCDLTYACDDKNTTCSLLSVSPPKAHTGNMFTFLTCPRIPLTVLTAAPSNLAISRSDVNMSLIRAVFLKILHGWPTSLIFFTIRTAWLNSNTEPVAVIRNADCKKLSKSCKLNKTFPFSTQLFDWTC